MHWDFLRRFEEDLSQTYKSWAKKLKIGCTSDPDFMALSITQQHLRPNVKGKS